MARISPGTSNAKLTSNFQRPNGVIGKYKGKRSQVWRQANIARYKAKKALSARGNAIRSYKQGISEKVRTLANKSGPKGKSGKKATAAKNFLSKRDTSIKQLSSKAIQSKVGANQPERKAVLLGEYMPRVKEACAANPKFRAWQARNWEKWKKEGTEKQKNIEWLRQQIRSGVDIYSLGKTVRPELSRGEYYKAEVTQLLKSGYRQRSAGFISVPTYGNVKLYKWEKVR